MMLFWAGLRGAVAFALAMEAESPSASVMRSTILIVVVLTVIFFGGTTPLFINYLGIQTGIESGHTPSPRPFNNFELLSDEDDINLNSYKDDQVDNVDLHRNSLDMDTDTAYSKAKSPDHPQPLGLISSTRASLDAGDNTWFNSIDDHILKPMFTHQKRPSMYPNQDLSRSDSRASKTDATEVDSPEYTLGVSGIDEEGQGEELHEVVVDDVEVDNPFSLDGKDFL